MQGGVVGKGANATVHVGNEKRTGQIVALKIFPITKDEPLDIDLFKSEIDILNSCNHQNVMKYYGSYLSKNCAYLWMVLEYLGGGSVADLIKPGPCDPSSTAIIMRESLKGLQYLHGLGIIHRDIKAANIVLNEHGDCKLSDLGTATRAGKASTLEGTPFWMAPEIILQKNYSTPADIWSLGITAIEIATGKAPLSDLHPMRAMYDITKNPPPTLTGDFKKDFKGFVAKCLQKEQEKRPTANILLKEKFVSKAKKVAVLCTLITRYKEWSENNDDVQSVDSDTDILGNAMITSPEGNLWDFSESNDDDAELSL
eukprot:m.323921 g.323921  ORF g.323921 m.323921 type:complete len:313 (-) comp16539_c0_seq25:1397-2335(-)